VINPSIENALVLRRVPRTSPIAIEALAEYVEADLMKGVQVGIIDPATIFRHPEKPHTHISVTDYILSLIKDRTLVSGVEYRRWIAKPAYVSLSDSTAVCLNTQPGIKKLLATLPISSAGLLDLFAQEC
jgi:hypothetical protein